MKGLPFAGDDDEARTHPGGQRGSRRLAGESALAEIQTPVAPLVRVVPAFAGAVGMWPGGSHQGCPRPSATSEDER